MEWLWLSSLHTIDDTVSSFVPAQQVAEADKFFEAACNDLAATDDAERDRFVAVDRADRTAEIVVSMLSSMSLVFGVVCIEPLVAFWGNEGDGVGRIPCSDVIDVLIRCPCFAGLLCGVSFSAQRRCSAGGRTWSAVLLLLLDSVGLIFLATLLYFIMNDGASIIHRSF